jgi:integrase
MALTEKGVARLTKPGRYFDRDGLYLQVQSPTNRSWLYRFELDGRERWMGLGAVKTFTLREARERARKARQQLADGIDPIEARLSERDARRKEAADNITFKEAATKFLALHQDGWRNAKHRQQWGNTLRDYAFGKLGDRPVKAIDRAVINEALAPIWSKIPATAVRVRHRIERVTKWVKDGMPLPTPRAVDGTKGHAALAYQEIPQFMVDLRGREGFAARALELTILTAARTGEVVGARWSEFDLKQKVWTIPATRMKSGRVHRVPLSDRALEILAELPREDGNRFVFVGSQAGKSIGDMAMLDLLRRIRRGVVVHGFRASFKTWSSEVVPIV